MARPIASSATACVEYPEAFITATPFSRQASRSMWSMPVKATSSAFSCFAARMALPGSFVLVITASSQSPMRPASSSADCARVSYTVTSWPACRSPCT